MKSILKLVLSCFGFICWILIFKAQGQTPSLQLLVKSNQLTLNYSPTITNGDFFILSSNTPQSLLSGGSTFYSGYVSNILQGTIKSNISDLGPLNFFTLVQYPNATPADLVSVPPIDDDDEGDVTNSYFFDVSTLPYPLTTNGTINLIISIDDSQAKRPAGQRAN